MQRYSSARHAMDPLGGYRVGFGTGTGHAYAGGAAPSAGDGGPLRQHRDAGPGTPGGGSGRRDGAPVGRRGRPGRRSGPTCSPNRGGGGPSPSADGTGVTGIADGDVWCHGANGRGVGRGQGRWSLARDRWPGSRTTVWGRKRVAFWQRVCAHAAAVGVETRHYEKMMVLARPWGAHGM